MSLPVFSVRISCWRITSFINSTFRIQQVKMVSKGPSSIQAEEVRFSALGHGRAKGLPMLCQELFLRYCLDLTEDTFQDFYHSTFPVFLSFAMERCALVKGMDLDPEEVVNRLYGILVAHAAGCRDRVPIKVLLSWCFGTVSNKRIILCLSLI